MTKPATTSDKTYHSIRSFLTYMRRFKWRFAIVLLVFALSNLALAVIPVFIGKLVGALSAHPVHGHQAIVWMWVLVGLSTAHDLLWRFGELLHMKLINPLSFEYETMLFRETIHKPYPYFVDKFTGKLSSYIATISREMRDFFDNLSYQYVGGLVNLVITGAIFATVNWQTGLVFGGGLVLMLIAGRFTIRNSATYEKLAADVQSTKNGKIVDVVANFVNVKSFRKEHREWQNVQREQAKTIDSVNRSFFWSVVFWGTMSFFVRDFIWPLTIALNVYLFLHGELSLAQLTTVLSAVLIFTATIWEVVWNVSQFNLRLARIEEAHRYLFGPINLLTHGSTMRPPAVAPAAKFRRSISLRDLHFAYPDKPDAAVLADINLTIKKGEKIGIVGRSGSGKTTLTKLLLDYYPLDSGLLLDDAAASSSQLARLISYVPQDTSLFHRTIAENIAYATEARVTQAAIVKAAKQAHAHQFISNITDGYDALVGERGVKLSAGQRQRIAIARAFLDDKPILILDEATSALDSESEVLVQQALEALWHDKTVIAIAHRLSTLRHMDRIIVLDQGRIAEQGSHEELLKQRGQYAEFWHHQSGGFIDE